MTRWFRILLALVTVIGIAYFGMHYWVKGAVIDYLKQKLPNTISLEYKGLQMNLLKGSLELDSVRFSIRDSITDETFFSFSSKTMGMYEVRYWNFIRKNELELTEFLLDAPDMTFRPYARAPRNDSLPPKTNQAGLQLDQFRITNGQYIVFPTKSDSVGIRIGKLDMAIDSLRSIHQEDRLIPFEWQHLDIHFGALHIPMKPYETLTIKNGHISTDSIHLSDLSIATQMPIQAYNKMLSHERDHYDLVISSIDFPFPNISKNGDSVQLQLPKLALQHPDFKVYRDKLMPDDRTPKTLLSAKLRNLPFQLGIDSVQVSNGRIKYTERTEYYNEGGSIYFSNLDVLATQVGNSYPKSDTLTIRGKGTFMNQASLDFDWRLPVYDETESFVFEAEVSELDASDMNVLTKNNIDLSLEGRIEACRFTIRGNDHRSYQNFRIRYHDLRVTMLNKKKGKKSWLGTALANLIVKKDSYTRHGDYLHYHGFVYRDPHKSFFNYIWLNVKEGLVHTMPLIAPKG